MKSFKEYFKEKNIELPEGNTISGAWFSEHGIPMVVRCACCEMTMASPSAWIDEDGYTFCPDCADVKEN